MEVKRFFVTSFLKKFKEQIANGNFLLVKRRKNLQTLTTLGFNYKNLKEVLLSLTLEDFSSGPEPNEEFPGIIMVFGKNVSTHEIYIKVSNTDKSGIIRKAICISFHIADYPIKYPYKRG